MTTTRVSQAQRRTVRVLVLTQAVGAEAIRVASAVSRARDGGVFRYSITCGSTPALRISARVLRDVPQAGLW